jgi:hypothetical protein
MEVGRLWPGAVAEALRECRLYLAQPGRCLQAPDTACECCDPLIARDLLDDALSWLPRGARADLLRLVDRLDDEFDRRAVALPEFREPGPLGTGCWWRLRLTKS